MERQLHSKSIGNTPEMRLRPREAKVPNSYIQAKPQALIDINYDNVIFSIEVRRISMQDD